MNANAKTLRTLSDLTESDFVHADKRAALEAVAARYAIAVTPAMADLIDHGNANDPIARQFIPDPAELRHHPGEFSDPIGDFTHSPIEGIVHRYPDRVLLKLTHLCAVYCRFCFRREMIGPRAHALSAAALDTALTYIEAHPQIWEIVLTGGDPLVLSPRRLKAVVARLAAIKHVAVIRVHTRVPVADPDRITPALVRALKAPDKATYVVIHANHPRELTASARSACARFIDNGIPMLSQTVLLRGVNDDPETLGELMRAFVASRIKPYYLHHADLVPGTSHLSTTIQHGQELMRALRGRYSGLCQPTYVLDIPGGHGKSPIGPNYISAQSAGGYRVMDFKGEDHCYPPPM